MCLYRRCSASWLRRGAWQGHERRKELRDLCHTAASWTRVSAVEVARSESPHAMGSGRFGLQGALRIG